MNKISGYTQCFNATFDVVLLSLVRLIIAILVFSFLFVARNSSKKKLGQFQKTVMPAKVGKTGSNYKGPKGRVARRIKKKPQQSGEKVWQAPSPAARVRKCAIAAATIAVGQKNKSRRKFGKRSIEGREENSVLAGKHCQFYNYDYYKRPLARFFDLLVRMIIALFAAVKKQKPQKKRATYRRSRNFRRDCVRNFWE